MSYYFEKIGFKKKVGDFYLSCKNNVDGNIDLKDLYIYANLIQINESGEMESTYYVMGAQSDLQDFSSITFDKEGTNTEDANRTVNVTISIDISGETVTDTKEFLQYGNDAMTVFTYIDDTTSVLYSDYVVKYKNNNVKSVKIGNLVTEIIDYAFARCPALESVTLPNTLTKIGNQAFSNCSSLTSITIPDSVTEIGDYAFYHCNNMESVTLSSLIQNIKKGVFSSCSSLTAITISDNVTNISDFAFFKCSSLDTININATNPPTLGDNIFSYVSETMKIYVPKDSLETYKTAEVWKNYESNLNEQETNNSTNIFGRLFSFFKR